MSNRSEYTASRHLQNTVKRQNVKVSKNETSVSIFSFSLLIIGTVGYLFTVAFFAG